MSALDVVIDELHAKVRELEGQVKHWREAWAKAQVEADVLRPSLAAEALAEVDPAFLFAGEPANCSLCGEAGHTHDDHWLFQHEPVKALRAQLLALHTVIDEGRRIMDRAVADDEPRQITGFTDETRDAIDEWRNRVLVKAARERVSGELAACEQHVRILEEPRNEYGLALAVEQEKVKLLLGAIDKAITWLVTVKADQPAGIIAERARLALGALQAVGK